MLRKDIKAFFKAIGSGDLEKVAQLIQADKAYLACCNFAPPQKDDGQSGLQIACKTGRFAIAKFLVEQGADVNFQETSAINKWTAPALHDCIRATLLNTCLLQSDGRIFDQASAVLRLMLERGASPQAQDSYGNASLHRALLDATQLLEHPRASSKQPLLLQQIKNVFAALLAAGADPTRATAYRSSPVAMAANYRLEAYELW